MAEDFSGSPEKPLKRRGTEEAEDRESPDNHETQVIENGFLPQGEKTNLTADERGFRGKNSLPRRGEICIQLTLKLCGREQQLFSY